MTAEIADIELRILRRPAAPSVAIDKACGDFDRTEAFARIESRTIYLDTDSPKSVAFGDLSSAALVRIVATGGKVRARITSADGSSQSVPLDPLHFTISISVPITAIDLTRVAGTPHTVSVSVTLGAPLT